MGNRIWGIFTQSIFEGTPREKYVSKGFILPQ